MIHCPAGTREDAHNAHKKTTSKRKKNATLIAKKSRAKKMQATLTVNPRCKNIVQLPLRIVQVCLHVLVC